MNCYENGVPIAGNSAGALILPETCLISPLDNEQSVMLFKQGVGLLSNVLISVHYTEWSDQSNLLEGMRTKKVKRGIGIDEQACAVFINGQLAYSLGEAVHEVIFEDDDLDQYTIVKGCLISRDVSSILKQKSTGSPVILKHPNTRSGSTIRRTDNA